MYEFFCFARKHYSVFSIYESKTSAAVKSFNLFSCQSFSLNLHKKQDRKSNILVCFVRNNKAGGELVNDIELDLIAFIGMGSSCKGCFVLHLVTLQFVILLELTLYVVLRCIVLHLVTWVQHFQIYRMSRQVWNHGYSAKRTE